MREPGWAPFVSFTVDVRTGRAPIVVARMPTEFAPWRIVRRELGRIAISYGARSTDIIGLEGIILPRAFAAFVRVDPEFLPECELWNWHDGAFRLVRKATKEKA